MIKTKAINWVLKSAVYILMYLPILFLTSFYVLQKNTTQYEGEILSEIMSNPNKFDLKDEVDFLSFTFIFPFITLVFYILSYVYFLIKRKLPGSINTIHYFVSLILILLSWMAISSSFMKMLWD